LRVRARQFFDKCDEPFWNRPKYRCELKLHRVIIRPYVTRIELTIYNRMSRPR
jgi:hypothetical protein